MKYKKDRPIAVFDTECYRNFWAIAFKNVHTGKVKSFQMYKNHPLDRAGIIRILRKFTIVGFNVNSYDMPMLLHALKQNATTESLKAQSDDIIMYRLSPWKARDKYNLPEKPSYIDSIDLIEVAPGTASLKIYNGRLHGKLMQDLPIEPDAIITDDLRPKLIAYHENDLDSTENLYNDLIEEIDLRYALSNDYDVDVRSKSDAQMAEAIIVKFVESKLGHKIERPEYSNDYKFNYQPYDCIKFKTKPMQEFYEKVKSAKYGFSEKDKVTIPAELKNAKIKLGSQTYKFGNGGLHSTEKSRSVYSDGEYEIWDWDVASYYPSIVIEYGLYPKALGEVFLDIYTGFRRERLLAPKGTVKNTGLKIFLNGSFGKLGSKWSKMYGPELMIQVTVTGQLALLMLIEELTLNDIDVISGNTDGIVLYCRKDQKDDMARIISAWEKTTGFTMESAQYKSLHSRDVNNYIAFYDNGKVKQKGVYAFVGAKGKTIEKNPSDYVCIDAVIEYIKNGTPVSEFLEFAPDFTRFLTVRKVEGGAVWRDEYLGKAIRWYYSKDGDTIHYQKNGNKVPETDGAKPCMTLPDGLPNDIDYDRYERECYKIMREIGYDAGL